MKRLIIDIDDTFSFNLRNNYSSASISLEFVEQLRRYKSDGFEIVLFSSRNMRTYNGNVGVINHITLPVLIDWLNKHNVPYDEIHVGKPWCGLDGFYVDDKAIRPSEFVKHTYQEILAILDRDRLRSDE